MDASWLTVQSLTYYSQIFSFCLFLGFTSVVLKMLLKKKYQWKSIRPISVCTVQGGCELRLMKQFTGLSVTVESVPSSRLSRRWGGEVNPYLQRWGAKCILPMWGVKKKTLKAPLCWISRGTRQSGGCALWHYSQAVRWFKAALLLRPASAPRLHCSPRTPPPLLLFCLHLSSPTSSLLAPRLHSRNVQRQPPARVAATATT